MKIDHAAVYVRDLENAKNFFVRFFQAEAGPLYHNAKTGFRSYFLTFDGGARLELMTRPCLEEKEKGALHLGWSHVAFAAGSRGQVDGLTDLLSRAGYEIVSGPRVTGDGYYESCISGLENILIEITE